MIDVRILCKDWERKGGFMFRKYMLLLYFAALLSFACSFTFANVSLKNGNFFIAYSDLVYPGGIEPKVERVYNSKSSHDGIFGFGWGSDYEVYLTPLADGSVVVHENGGGAHNRFTPPAINASEIDKAVEMMLTAKKSTGLSAGAMEAEKQRLRNDARYRTDEWERLYVKKLVKAREVAPGTVLKSNKYSFQTIQKVKEGYMRRFDNGQAQLFNNDGKCVRVSDRNGNYLALTYDKTGHLATFQDNLNRRMKFKFNSQGKVVRVDGDSGKVTTYDYKGNELVFSKDTAGNEYRYKYSGNGRHNLVEIKYKDNTTMQMGFFDLTKCENVNWVKDRDGTLSEYTYTGDCVSGLEHSTTVVVKGSDGKEVSKSKYEYVEKIKLDGERYTYKLSSEVDGDKTVTIYNECCGLPLEIAHNGEKTTFEYDTKGHVTKKMTPAEVTDLEYDSKTSKVSKVVKYSKSDASKKSVKWAQYQYDEKGNLSYAKNSEGKGVKIVYDHYGRIKALVDQDKRRLEFTYNEASRPVEIRDPSVGKIQVQYTNTGEIKKVDSSGGRKIALQVTSAFQNLLEIIRPAGVTLAY